MLIRFAGGAMIVTAFALWGSSRSAEERARVRLLSALISALESVRSEVVTYLAPLPEIAERLSREGPAETRPFFAQLSAGFERLGETSFAENWSGCAAALELPEEEKRIVADVGRSLGRYGAPEQAAALTRSMAALAEALENAEAEAAAGGRLWTGLGVTAGMLLAILLF